MIVKSITVGVCTSLGTCPVSPKKLAYNLNNLLHPKQILKDSINPAKHVKNFIVENSVLNWLADLLLKGFKFIGFTSSKMTTLLQKGVTRLLAFLYVFFFPSKLPVNESCRKVVKKLRWRTTHSTSSWRSLRGHESEMWTCGQYSDHTYHMGHWYQSSEPSEDATK